MLQNAKVAAFTVSEFLRENHRGRVIPTHTRLGLKWAKNEGYNEWRLPREFGLAIRY